MTDQPAPPRSDRALLLLLFLLNLGSAATTVLGARQVLPSPLAELLGLTVQGILFLLLAGFAARHAPLRRWLVVGVFAAFSVYTSFFAYHRTLAGEQVEAEGRGRAAQAHAAFVSAAWQPALTERDRLLAEAEETERLAREEAARGVTTGAVGYGPKAREYDAKARQLRARARELQVDLERLEPAMVLEVAGMAPEEVHAADLAAWQLLPSDWKRELPAPARGDYVDASAQVSLLTPFHRVAAGDLPAVVALLIAMLVDGICILLGTAIGERQGGPGTGQRVAAVVEAAKDELAAVQLAWSRPGLPRRPRERTMASPAPAPRGEELLLHLEGRPSDFLGAFYEAIHPETGEVDLQALLEHPQRSWRVAARLLADRLRQPPLGWLRVRDGWWCVAPGRYDALTQWISAELHRAVEAERASPAGEGGEVLNLRLPAAA